ncbi:flagellar basal body-associated FliL family protein [Ruficoccus amylovorans]|uniref:Flagellar protein FliL n=1 Tax=Ruficoccus amylovorans TaxID=1804625 RepID=A0A842HEK1_9BACT|nr:flagellar basal body-associated FliL family protein [Ruficoccus amylovorans]MBC2595015.1 flagellar basal body-associated FliL family protein [Ruficoccus amylovorans]
MAEDTENPPPAPAKAPIPWLPLGLVLLIIPVITLLLTEFFVIPRLKSSLVAEVRPASAEAPEPPAAEEESSDAHAAKTESAETGDHSTGKNKGGTVTFEEMISNLSGTMGTRFIKVSFEISSSDQRLSELVAAHRPRVQDAIITTLSSHTIQQIEAVGGRDGLRLALMGAINEALGEQVADHLYFTEFIIQ